MNNENEMSCDVGQPLLSVSDALNTLLDSVVSHLEREEIDLLEAGGRILADDICSIINVPPADNSAMDGYAVHCDDFIANGKQPLRISQRICAGEVGVRLEEKTVARIFTGAPIPAGANAVVMQERCEAVGDEVIIENPVSRGANIRKAGEDIAIGDIILKAGDKLRPQDMGLIASIGIRKLSVYRRLRVGIFFTGNELREPGNTLQAGQIYNSNRYTLRGLLCNLNCDLIDLGIVEDTLEATIKAMQIAAEKSDVVMTSGGVSVGEEDYVRLAIEALGQLNIWRINIKPGKPLAFGTIGNTPFLGMPGNPVSVFATFCIFAHPYLLKKSGATTLLPKSIRVIAAFEWKRAGSRCEYVRARRAQDESGQSFITLFSHQGSGVLTSVSWANGLAVIPPNTAIKKGDQVEFIPFNEMSVF